MHPEALKAWRRWYEQHDKIFGWQAQTGSWYLRSYLRLGWRTTEGVPSDWFGVCTSREREREARCFLIWSPAPECHLRALAGFHPCDFVLLHRERRSERKRYCGHFDASSQWSYCISFLTSVWMDPVTLGVTLSALLLASESLQCEWVLLLWSLSKLLDEWGLVDTIIELFNTHKRLRSPFFFFFFCCHCRRDKFESMPRSISAVFHESVATHGN